MKSCTSDLRTKHPTPWAPCRCRADSRAQPQSTQGSPKECGRPPSCHACSMGHILTPCGVPSGDCFPPLQKEENMTPVPRAHLLPAWRMGSECLKGTPSGTWHINPGRWSKGVPRTTPHEKISKGFPLLILKA